MSALLCASLLVLILWTGGAALRRVPGWPVSDPAVSAVSFLAIWILVEVDVAAAWRFAPAAAVTVVAVLLAVGLLARVFGIGRAGQPLGGKGSANAAPRAETRLLLLVALALAVPLLRLPLPFDTDAQGFGELALSIRDGGSLVVLGPWRSGIRYLYAPGALTLFATLSSMLPGVPMSAVMMGAAHAMGLLFVALAGSFGEELGRAAPLAVPAADASIRPETWRRAAQLCAIAAFGLWTALLDSHDTAVAGLTFALGALVAWFRAWRTGAWRDVALAGLLLSALVVTHQDTALAAALGLVPLFAAVWAVAGRDRRRLLARTVAGVGLAAALLVPWILVIAPLLSAGVSSPFRISTSHASQLVLYQGIAPLLALAGLVLSLRHRVVWSLGMLAWLALLVDFSTTGMLQRALPGFVAPIVRFDYPFSLAWHGPILPFLALGVVAVVAGAARSFPRFETFPGVRSAAAAALAIVLVGAGARPLLAFARRHAAFYGALASENDLQAMLWIARTAPRGARVLNYPGDFEHGRDWEGHWAPVITERDCVYMRMQPFFLPRGDGRRGGPDDAVLEQREMLAFWRDPADPSNASRLARAGIRYVLLPEAVGDPAAAGSAWRGRLPALFEGARSQPDSAAYLAPVFRAGGAAVYELR